MSQVKRKMFICFWAVQKLEQIYLWRIEEAIANNGKYNMAEINGPQYDQKNQRKVFGIVLLQINSFYIVPV